MQMTSPRPYLIRAFYDWIADNHYTPYIVVDATYPNTVVPANYVEGGQIVLNISMSAVQGLALGDKAVEFRARFDEKVFKIYAPMGSIMAIYAKENGRGIVLNDVDSGGGAELGEMMGEHKKEDGKDDSGSITSQKDEGSNDDDKGGGTGGDKGGSSSRGRPNLTIVK